MYFVTNSKWRLIEKKPCFYTGYALLLTQESKKPYSFRNSFWKQHLNSLQSMNWLCIGKLSLLYNPMSDARSQLARSAACLGVCQTELEWCKITGMSCFSTPIMFRLNHFKHYWWCGGRRGNKSVLKWGNTYGVVGTKNINGQLEWGMKVNVNLRLASIIENFDKYIKNWKQIKA